MLTLRKFLTSKSLIHMTIWLLSAMVIAVLGCLVYFLHSLDHLVASGLAQRVELAKKIEAKHRRDLLEEYTFWDEAYTKIVIERDAEWIEYNTGRHFLKKSGYDFSASMVKENEVFLIKTSDTRHLTFGDLKPYLLDLEALSNKSESNFKLVNGFFRLNTEVYHIVGGPFVDEESENAIGGTYLAIGKRIDHDYLSEIEAKYQLFGLKLSLCPNELEYYTVLHNDSGEAVGYLSWEPPLPSKETIPMIIIAIILFAIVVTFVMCIILGKEQASRAEYEEQLFMEATTDALTSVYSRRYFMSVGAKELDVCKRLKERLFAVLVLDIDHFKAINDQYGHNVGDKALAHFANVCLTGLRESDILGRIGGEEFAVILPNTNTEKAFEVANRIRSSVAKTPFVSKGLSIRLTVSIGVAELGDNDHLEAVVEKADKALYEAKNSGRDRVIICN